MCSVIKHVLVVKLRVCRSSHGQVTQVRVEILDDYSRFIMSNFKGTFREGADLEIKLLIVGGKSLKPTVASLMVMDCFFVVVVNEALDEGSGGYIICKAFSQVFQLP